MHSPLHSPRASSPLSAYAGSGGPGTAASLPRRVFNVACLAVVLAWAFDRAFVRDGGDGDDAGAGCAVPAPAVTTGEDGRTTLASLPPWVVSGPSETAPCFDVPHAALDRYPALPLTPERPIDVAVDVLFVRAVATAESGAAFEGVLCNRSRPPPLLAIPGGYVELGESVDNAASRELLEETGIDVAAWLPSGGAGSKGTDATPFGARSPFASLLDGVGLQPALTPLRSSHEEGPATSFRDVLQPLHFGVRADPTRDKRRHTASVQYVFLAPVGSPAARAVPHGRDDVKHCQYWDLERLARAEFGEGWASGRRLKSANRRGGKGRSGGDGPEGTQGVFAFDHGSTLVEMLRALKRAAASKASSLREGHRASSSSSSVASWRHGDEAGPGVDEHLSHGIPT